MNFIEVTNRYYAKWLGVDSSLLKEKGIFFIESSEREKQQIGYPQIFNIYAYVKGDLVIISYSKKYKDEIGNLKSKIKVDINAEELSNILGNELNTNVAREIKFYYEEPKNPISSKEVIKLFDKDYDQYLTFFKTQHPNANTESWLSEYFRDLCTNGLAFGIFKDEKLVSVTDGPDMPYMGTKVQEIGINTLSEYRGQGYAKLVVTECIESIISNNKCPIWSCNFMNSASAKLAYSVGFKRLADVLTVSF